LKGLIENGVTTDYQIESGFTKARAHNSPFLPSIGQFIGWCKDATETQWPPMEAVFAELQSMLAQNRKDWHECTPLLQHIVGRTLDLYNYKQVFKDYDRVKLFDIAYKAALFQLEGGEELRPWPHPKTLLENNQEVKRHDAPESVKLADEVLVGLRAMLDEKPEPKPLTPAEIADLEKLERLKKL
jgi:hypothetical protein